MVMLQPFIVQLRDRTLVKDLGFEWFVQINLTGA